MYNQSLVLFQRLLIVVTVALLTACGGGGGGGSTPEQNASQTEPAFSSQLFIAGAGIKGPLAFASVELYTLDTDFWRLYDPENPIAEATTDAYAEITGLGIPPDSKPPYILVIDGTNAIDRNTGVAPVISKLVTVITQESLDSMKPVYATPYTTLAYDMLLFESDRSGLSLAIGDYLDQFNQDIIQAIGFGMPGTIDIFSTPPIITSAATSIEEQQLAVNYRAAIEALSSLVYQLSLSSIRTDRLLRILARDLRSDGVIDGSVDGLPIPGIDTAVLSQNPELLEIPNTQYLVRDIVTMIDEERSLVGSSSNVEFFKNDLAVTLTPALLDSRIDSSQQIVYNETVESTASSLLLAGAIASTPVSAGEIFRQDFDSNSVNVNTALTTNQIRNLFKINGGASVKNQGTPGVMVVDDPLDSGNKVFQVSFPKGSNRTNGGGAQWVTRIPAADEYYFAYDMYVPVGFNWPLSSKLPGLFGGDLSTVSGGSIPDGIRGWQARQGVVSEKSKGDTLGYSGIGDGNLGANPHTFKKNRRARYNYALVNKQDENSAKLVPGKWVRIEQHVKLNTATSTAGVGYKSDGIYEAWVDGVKVFSTKDYDYRIIKSLKIDAVSFVWFYGGTGDDYAAREDQAYYFDNFIVSTQRIGPRY